MGVSRGDKVYEEGSRVAVGRPAAVGGWVREGQPAFEQGLEGMEEWAAPAPGRKTLWAEE